MKTRVLKTLLAAAAVAGWLATSVEASNIVGYIKLDVLANDLKLMSIPFTQVGGAPHTLDTAFRNVRDGTEIHVFVRGTPDKWFSFTYYGDLGWVDEDFNPAGGFQLNRGSGFWLKNVSPEVLSLVVNGEVLVADNNVPLLPGVQLVSYGFPTEADLATYGPQNPSDSDELFVHQGGVSWVSYTYYQSLGWVDEDFNPVSVTLTPLSAYWYKAAAQNTWLQIKNFNP